MDAREEAYGEMNDGEVKHVEALHDETLDGCGVLQLAGIGDLLHVDEASHFAVDPGEVVFEAVSVDHVLFGREPAAGVRFEAFVAHVQLEELGLLRRLLLGQIRRRVCNTRAK